MASLRPINGVFMRKFILYQPFFVVLLFNISCRSAYQTESVQYNEYRITQNSSSANKMTALLKPYSDSVNKSMNDEIAVAAVTLEKKQPEGTLGNVLADAMLIMAREKYQTAVDASFINYGGIRLSAIPKGSILRGKVFELSPFDNIIVLLTLNGKVLQQFLNHIAARGGWPCAGISFQVKDKVAVNVKIAGKAFDIDKNYVIALADYVANGGDDCVMLKNISQQNNGYLFRDAVLNYFSKLNDEGKQISASIENRVTNAE